MKSSKELLQDADKYGQNINSQKNITKVEANTDSRLQHRQDSSERQVLDPDKTHGENLDWILGSPSLKKSNTLDLEKRVDMLPQDCTDGILGQEPLHEHDLFNNRLEKLQVELMSKRLNPEDSSANLEELLKMRVAFAGQNIEKSIRKVISLARVILEKPKLILLYEEAINFGRGVGYNIDVLKARCPESTVMSITRSNRSILSYDQIILMDGGMIIDQGDPIELIGQEHSHFYNYLKETDHATFLLLKQQMEIKTRGQARQTKSQQDGLPLAT